MPLSENTVISSDCIKRRLRLPRGSFNMIRLMAVRAETLDPLEGGERGVSLAGEFGLGKDGLPGPQRESPGADCPRGMPYPRQAGGRTRPRGGTMWVRCWGGGI